MSPFARETMQTAKKRSWRVSALSSALLKLLEQTEVDDHGPIIGLAETLEREAGELDEVIAIQIERLALSEHTNAAR